MKIVKIFFIVCLTFIIHDVVRGEPLSPLSGRFEFKQAGKTVPVWYHLPAMSFIEPIFDAMKASTNNRTEQYQLYGHSAGAQFAHRFLYFVPNARVSQIVAANAGWWMLPDMDVDFPFGLKGAPGVGHTDSGMSAFAVKWLFEQPKFDARN